MHPGPILFCGDPHGQWQHIIDAALQTHARAVILLGDLEPARPLHIELEAIWERVWFIHGNHDTDHADNFANVWHPELAERSLHGRVVTLPCGTRVAGLGGVFRGAVWYPKDAQAPRFHNRQAHARITPHQDRWQNGMQLKHWSSIYPDEVEQLASQQADILITHEAPGYHEHGFKELDTLARRMGVRMTVHGHQHDCIDSSAHWAAQGFQSYGVGLRGVMAVGGELTVNGHQQYNKLVKYIQCKDQNLRSTIQMLDPNDAIILACAAQGGAMASVATEQTGLTRVAVSRRIKKLADSGYLQRHGTGTRQTYSLGNKRFWLGLQQRESILQRGGEMAVWEQRLAPLLTDLKPNVKSLVNTAFTEMLNNALDHSNGLQVLMGMHMQDGQLEMLVADDGEGIFYKIAGSAHLFDERLAILELAKGKFTTAAQGHSGMGIFVSSRMMDGFAIESCGLRFDPNEASTPLARFDWIDVNAALKPSQVQTVVRMSLAVDSTRTCNDVYFKYFEASNVGEAEPGEAFHTTEIPVRLAQLSSELVSRSQAKWVMNRATQFKTVVLDFEGVAHVGQAFVDEVFRVFATAHPHVRLKTMGMTPEVAKLVSLFGGA